MCDIDIDPVSTISDRFAMFNPFENQSPSKIMKIGQNYEKLTAKQDFEPNGSPQTLKNLEHRTLVGLNYGMNDVKPRGETPKKVLEKKNLIFADGGQLGQILQFSDARTPILTNSGSDLVSLNPISFCSCPASAKTLTGNENSSTTCYCVMPDVPQKLGSMCNFTAK